MKVSEISGYALTMCLIFTIDAAFMANYNSNPTQVVVYRHFPGLSIHRPNDQICGGTIIGVRHVLTSNNCLRDLQKTGYSRKQLSIGCGCTHFDACELILGVREVWMRQKYFTSPDGWTHFLMIDTLAVLITEKNIEYSASMKPATLQRTFTHKDGEALIVSLWGTTGNYTEPVQSPARILVRLINNEKCEERIEAANSYTREKIFTGHLSHGKYCVEPVRKEWNCKNTIGRGLLKGNYILGVLSSCRHDNGIMIFIRLGDFYDWIMNIVNGSGHNLGPGTYKDSILHYGLK